MSAARREPTRLHRDVVRAPVLYGRSAVVLHGNLPVGQSEAVDGDVDPSLTGPAHVRDVQLAAVGADDPDTDAAERQLPDCKPAAQERAGSEPHVEAVELEKGRPRLAIRET